MLKLRKSGRGYLIKFTRWEITGGAGNDVFELALTSKELNTLFKLLKKHYEITKYLSVKENK